MGFGTGRGQPIVSSQWAEAQLWEVPYATSKSSEEFLKRSAAMPEESGHSGQQVFSNPQEAREH